MKKQLPLLIISLFLFQCLCKAQKRIEGSVKGILVDTTHRESMANAAISVINRHDSSLVSHTIANKGGDFLLGHLNAGNYVLVVSFQGYQTVQKKFSLSAKVPRLTLEK